MSIEPASQPSILDEGVNGATPLLMRLLAASEALAADASLTTRLRIVTEALIGFGGAECVGVYLWDEQRRRLSVGYEHTIAGWPGVNAPGTVVGAYADGVGLDELRPGAIIDTVTVDLPPSPERTRREAAAIAASLRVALHDDGHLLGVLELFRRTGDGYSQSDISAARVVAREVTLIVVNSLLIADLIAERQANRAVFATAQAAAAQADPRGILRRIIRDLRATLDAECMQIEVWHPRDGRVDVIAEATNAEWPEPLPGVVGYYLTDWPSLQKLLDGAEHMLLRPPSPTCTERERHHLRSRGIAAALHVPIRAGDEVVGAIVEQTTREDASLLTHLPILQKIATIASIPTRAARTSANRHLDDRRRLLMQHLSTLIAVESNLEDLLDEATHGLVDATRADMCIIRLEGPDTELLANRSAIASHLTRKTLTTLDLTRWPAIDRLGPNRRIVPICADDDDVGAADADTLRASGIFYGLLADVPDEEGSWGTIALLFPDDVQAGEFAMSVLGETVQLLAAAASGRYLLRDSARKTADLEIMLGVSRSAISGDDIDTVLDEIAQHIVRHERFATCAVYLLDPATHDMHRLTYTAKPGHSFTAPPPEHSPFTGSRAASEALTTCRPIEILASDTQLSPAESARFALLHLGSVILAPLHVGHHVYGMMLLGSPATQSFLDRHFRFVEEIAAQASLAIDRARLISALTARADQDGLTGLLNHRAIQERFDALLADAAYEKRTLSILMVDLDGFKLFNDTYGHLVGDRYLREAASHIAASLGDSGLLGRYGGDEFLAVIPDAGPDEAAASARAILDRIRAAAFVIEDARIPLQLSIGAASFPLQGRSRRALIERADASMYAAKDAGGGRVVQFDHVGFAGGNDSFSVLSGLVQAVDRKDRYTRIHSDRVTALAVAMGRHLDLSPEEVEALYIAGQLHDVGKIAVPDNLLLRPGSVTPEQAGILQQHVAFSEMMIRDVPHHDLVWAAVAHHHERWDGSGYPRGLAGEEISLLGRVLAIADSVAAMTQDRPYIKARSWDYAVAEVRANAGAQFDPTLAPKLATLLEEIGATGAPMPTPPAALTGASSDDPG